MATMGTGRLTLADWAASSAAGVNLGPIINLMSQAHDILNYLLWLEGNLTTGNKTKQLTGLPEIFWRLINQGIPNSKSASAMITDGCGRMEARSQVDTALLELYDGQKERDNKRLEEDAAFWEAMAQEFESTLWYGNPRANPERFAGLTPRYSTLDATKAKSASCVIDAGGTGSTNTSIWVLTFGPRQTYCFFPKGSKAGFEKDDLGTTWPGEDAEGNKFKAVTSQFLWRCGLTVRDYRRNIRIANIDVSALNSGAAADLIVALIKAVNRLPIAPSGVGPVQTVGQGETALVPGRTVICCNRTVATYLDVQMINKKNLFLTMGDWDGKPVTLFRKIPVVVCDGLLNTEARVV